MPTRVVNPRLPELNTNTEAEDSVLRAQLTCASKAAMNRLYRSWNQWLYELEPGLRRFRDVPCVSPDPAR